MGYYSQVGFAFQGKENIEKWNNIVNDNSNLQDFLESADRYEILENDCLVWFDGVKWYDGDPDVLLIETFRNSLEFKDYLFICLGEDITDNEYYGQYYSNTFNLGWERKIVF